VIYFKVKNELSARMTCQMEVSEYLTLPMGTIHPIISKKSCSVITVPMSDTKFQGEQDIFGIVGVRYAPVLQM
jgi:hypothetical protein